MQIVVKLTPERVRQGKALLRDAVAAALPDVSAQRVKVEKVFPENTPGNRGRLFNVELPDELPDETCRAVIETMQRHAAVEYANVPAPRRPMR